MRGELDQQSQIAWETVVNDVEKLVLWLYLGLLYSCPFLPPINNNISNTQFILSLHIAICRGVQVPDSVNI